MLIPPETESAAWLSFRGNLYKKKKVPENYRYYQKKYQINIEGELGDLCGE